MPWKINEVDAEVHAFDPSALLTDDVMKVLTARVAAAMRDEHIAKRGRERDSAIGGNRRAQD